MSIRTDLAVEMIDEDAKSLPKGSERHIIAPDCDVE